MATAAKAPTKRGTRTPARKTTKRALAPLSTTATTVAAPKISSPVRPEQQHAKIYTSPPLDIGFAKPEHRFVRADLEIEGIYHGEVSYEGRIFLNNPNAGPDTPETIEEGFAGMFTIFGHGGCLGDPGHCEVSRRTPNDLRTPHPLTPAKKSVRVTDALRAVARNADTATITVVPVVMVTNELCDTKNVFRCNGMRFVTYNG